MAVYHTQQFSMNNNIIVIEFMSYSASRLTYRNVAYKQQEEHPLDLHRRCSDLLSTNSCPNLLFLKRALYFRSSLCHTWEDCVNCHLTLTPYQLLVRCYSVGLHAKARCSSRLHVYTFNCCRSLCIIGLLANIIL